jgi:AcrR family transcriptional regulator
MVYTIADDCNAWAVTYPSTTAESILHAARRAIATRGPERLTMSAVAAAAGVSRPTLYRWFPTKADLLGAIRAYEESQFDIGLQAVLDAHRSPRRRLDAALRYLMTYLDESMMREAIAADPTFALEGLADSLGPHTEILARLLGDALDEVPAVRARRLSREQAAEIFLRMAYSHYLIPHEDAVTLLGTLRDFAGMTHKNARALAG